MAPHRLPHVRRRLSTLFVAVVLLAIPAVVMANHEFPDVPSSHPFHADISAMAQAGITAGYADGGFHPAEPVTRQAMAAFLKRGLGHVARRGSTAPDSASLVVAANVMTSSWTFVRHIDVTVPGVYNRFVPNQSVYVQANVVFKTAMDASEGCPCEFGAFVTDVGGAQSSWQYQTFSSTSSKSLAYAFPVEALFYPQSGYDTFSVAVFLNNRANVAPAATFEIDPTTSITTFSIPFDNSR
jgi:S-layer homology domain